MFAEAFHSMIKGIHLALEVKTSFGNSTPVKGFRTEPSTWKPRLPTDSSRRLHRKKRRGGTCKQKVTKQSLSNYAQQDWPVVAKQLDF
jgi:hypothetical protein